MPGNRSVITGRFMAPEVLQTESELMQAISFFRSQRDSSAIFIMTGTEPITFVETLSRILILLGNVPSIS